MKGCHLLPSPIIKPTIPNTAPHACHLTILTAVSPPPPPPLPSFGNVVFPALTVKASCDVFHRQTGNQRCPQTTSSCFFISLHALPTPSLQIPISQCVHTSFPHIPLPLWPMMGLNLCSLVSLVLFSYSVHDSLSIILSLLASSSTCRAVETSRPSLHLLFHVVIITSFFFASVSVPTFKAACLGSVGHVFSPPSLPRLPPSS